MDPGLLQYYNRELQFLREMGAEFGREYPKIAARLGLDEFECADPYVERLLEGFAFLAARIQFKIDAEFPAFTQHLLEMVYPHYLAPIPSMAVVRLEPNPAAGPVKSGFKVPRGTSLLGIKSRSQVTQCRFRTAHDVTLWPLDIAEAEYLAQITGLGGLAGGGEGRAGFRLRLRTPPDLPLRSLPVDTLPLHLRGSEELPMQIYENLLGNFTALVAKAPGDGDVLLHLREEGCLRRLGFSEEEALLPYGPRSFQGYRYLQEYFAFPQRFLFVELRGLEPAFRRATGSEIDLYILLDRSDPALEPVVQAANFALFCTPVINLFPKRSDRVQVEGLQEEYQVIPDRTRPLDFEVHSVEKVIGHGKGAMREQEFRPFYAVGDADRQGDNRAYYAVNRRPRLLSSREKEAGSRSSYLGGEVFLSLVDPDRAPYAEGLRQLSVETNCTNRDLPMHMPLGAGETDFTIESGAPVASIRVLSGPTRPGPSFVAGDRAWRLISHLSLNYLSLVDTDSRKGAEALRQVLSLYVDRNDTSARRQVEGIRSIRSRPVARWLTRDGFGAVVRGIEVTLEFLEESFKGTGVFLLGAVLDEFFARYVSLNSFTETVIRSEERGEIMRWPARTGRRHIL